MADIKNYTLNFGPQHPAAHGVLRLVLELDGEVIQRADPHIGLLHRATEKLAETRTYIQSLPYMDRLDYVSMMCNEHAYCLAIEKLARRRRADPRPVHPRHVRRDHAVHEPPDVARRARPRLRRDERLHLLLPRARGPVRHVRGGLRARACTRPTTARAASTATCPTRCRSTAQSKIRGAKATRELNENRQGSLLDFIDDFSKRFPEQGRRVRDPAHRQPDLEAAHGRASASSRRSARKNLGFTGPMLRGSGVLWDLRKHQPYEVYDRMDFDVPIGSQRRHLRPLSGARRGDAPGQPHHPPVRRLAACQPGAGDHCQPQGRAACRGST